MLVHYSLYIELYFAAANVQCPVQGHRARSTHAAVGSVFDTVSPSVKSWEEVPGPKPLPLLGNTWRFVPYIGKFNFTYIIIDIIETFKDTLGFSRSSYIL